MDLPSAEPVAPSPPAREGPLAAVYRTYVVELRARADAEADEARARGVDVDRRMATVVLTVIASLVFMRFFGSAEAPDPWLHLFEALGREDWSHALRDALTRGEGAQFARKVYWAAARVVGYVLLPVTVALVALLGRAGGGRGRVALVELFGLGTRGFLAHAPVYLVMLLVIAPFVVAASFAPSFQLRYPFYRLVPGESFWPYFVAWEALYALQFVALEIFYRGFMVHGLKPRFGHGSIFVMMIPYMMIHFGKPLPECLGSIVAGYVLGTMSLRSGSIWWGAILHVVVAWSMDALSLRHQGLL